MSVRSIDSFKDALIDNKEFETLIKEKKSTSAENLYLAATQIFDAASKTLSSPAIGSKKDEAMDLLLKSYIILKESKAPNSPVHQERSAVGKFFSWSLRQHNQRIATAEKMFEVHFSSYIEAKHHLHIDSKLESELTNHTDHIEITLKEMGIGLTEWNTLKSALVHGDKKEAKRLWDSILAKVKNIANNLKIFPDYKETKNFLLGTKELATFTKNSKFRELEGKINLNLQAPAVQREWIKLRVAIATKGEEGFAKQVDAFLSFKKTYESKHPQKTISKPVQSPAPEINEDEFNIIGNASQEQAIQKLEKTDHYKKLLTHTKQNLINAYEITRKNKPDLPANSLKLTEMGIKKAIDDAFTEKLKDYTNKELEALDDPQKAEALTKKIANKIYDESLSTQLKNIKEGKGTEESEEKVRAYFEKYPEDINLLNLEQLQTLQPAKVINNKIAFNKVFLEKAIQAFENLEDYKKDFNLIKHSPIDALQIARRNEDNSIYTRLTDEDFKRFLHNAIAKELSPKTEDLYVITKTRNIQSHYPEIYNYPLSEDLEDIKEQNKNDPSINRVFTYFGKYPQDIGFLSKKQREDLLALAESAIKDPAMSDHRKLELEAIIRVLNPNSSSIPKHSIENKNATRKLVNSDDVINEFKNIQEYKNFVFFLETHPDEAKKLRIDNSIPKEVLDKDLADQFLLKKLEAYIKSIHENDKNFVLLKQRRERGELSYEYDERDLVPHFLYNKFNPTPENIKNIFDNIVDKRFTKTMAPERVPDVTPITTEEKAEASPAHPQIPPKLREGITLGKLAKKMEWNEEQTSTLYNQLSERFEETPPLEEMDEETKLLSDLFDSEPNELHLLKKDYWNSFPLKLWESSLPELSSERLKVIPQGLLPLSLLIPFKNQLVQRFKNGDKDLQNKLEGTYMLLFASVKRLKSPVLSLLSTLNTHLEMIQNDLNSKNIDNQHDQLNKFLKGIDANFQVSETVIRSFNTLLDRTAAIYNNKKNPISKENRKNLKAFSKTINAFIERTPALQEAKEANKLSALDQYPFNRPPKTKQRIV